MIILLILLLVSCNEPVYRIYTGNAPVYMSYSEFRSSVTIDNSVTLENPGKVYLSGNLLFIVEELKGIHIYDNSNPASPVKKTFVKIPGVTDISVSGTKLYADSYIDLVVLDIGNLDNISVSLRSNSRFTYLLPPRTNNLPTAVADKDKGVVIEWEVRSIKEKDIGNEYFMDYVGPGVILEKMNPAGASSGKSGDGIGANGSLPRFAIADDKIFIPTESEMFMYSLATLGNPVRALPEYSLYDLKTISVSGKYMFLGTYYYSHLVDITSPLSIQPLLYFDEVYSCSPFAVDDTLIFSTSRTGTFCGSSSNILSVISISDIQNPRLLKEYQMTAPLGFVKEGDILFVCDTYSGLTIYDASDPLTMTIIKTYPEINAHNVLIYNDILVLLSNDGIYQYDYSDLQNITLLSSIIPGK